MLLPALWVLVSFAGGEVDATLAADPHRMLDHISLLASDVLEGREAGTRGAETAARYLVAKLRELGIAPAGDEGGFLQVFPLDAPRVSEVEKAQEAHSPSASLPPKRGTTSNVLAFLPGGDPELSKEWIVVGAHYDHVGRGELPNTIHNGADDNASGTAGVLEIARLLGTSSRKLKRSVLLAFFGAEEEGLLGSLWYVNHPVRPLADTVYMLNMDMIGRSRYRTLYVGGVGTAPTLRERVTRWTTALKLLPVLGESGRAPSDNTCFDIHGIPVTFLFTGVHEDYHQTGDDWEKIDSETAAAVATLGLRLVQEIADLPERLPFQHTATSLDYWSPRAYIGMTYDTAAGGGAVLDIVLAGSPAERSGLRPGDVILAVRGTPVSDAAGLAQLLKTMPIGEPLPCRVQRDGRPIEIALTLGVR